MKLKNALLAASAIIAFTSCQASARGDKDWSVGMLGLVGFADSKNLVQLPVQTSAVLTSNTDTGGINGGLGLTIAYDLNRATGVPITLELGSTWRYRHDFNISYADTLPYAAKLNVMSIDTMLSALYAFDTGSAFTPYIGGGAGVVFHHAQSQHLLGGIGSIDAGNTSDWNLAWQLQGGINYTMTENWSVRADYRFIDMGQVHSVTMPNISSSHFIADIYSHDIRFGMQYSF